MTRYLFAFLFSIIATGVFAQKAKDTLIYNLPVENGRLIYKDSITLKGRSKASLDTAAVSWFKGYFKYYKPDSLANANDPENSIEELAILEFNVRPGLINIPYQAVITIHIGCRDNNYTYEIYNIRFGPRSSSISYLYQHNPEYLIGLYKQKHAGFMRTFIVDKGMIRNYLTNMNTAILACIASLKKAMAAG